MPKNTRNIHGIDLNAPGGIAALFNLHRATFGDATMSVAPGEAGTPPAAPAGEPAGTPATPGTPPAAPGATPASPAAPATPPAPPAAERVEDLPAWAQKALTDARKDAGDERVAAKTLAAIQKALTPEAEGTPADPEALTKALAERDTAAKQAQTELATYKLAGTLGADAEALLDSRSFLAKIADLNPSDTAGIKTAIEDAVKDNPKLKAVLAAPKSGTNFSGGPGEAATKRVGLNDALNSHYGTK